MLLNIRQLLNRDLDVLEFNHTLDLQEPEMGIKPPAVLESSGFVKRESGIFTMTINVSGNVTTQCARCLKDAQWDVEVTDNFEMNFSDEDSDNYFELVDYSIDLDYVVKQELIMNLPSQILCSEECRGICPQCGTDLNIDKCECDLSDVDPRFEALKDFFNRP